MSDEDGPRPFPPSDGPPRRIGPYEQSLRDQSKQVAKAVARRAARKRRHRILAGVAGLAVLGGGTYAALTLFGGPETLPTSSSTSAVPTHCDDPSTVTVAVPAAMGPALADITAALAGSKDGPCTTFELESTESSVVFRTLGTAARPDGWVTDSSIWVSQANAGGAKLTQPQPFASSAIIVAMPADRAKAAGASPTWAELTKGDGAVRFPDPSRSTVGLLSLAAVGASVPESDFRPVVTAAAKAPAGVVELASLAKAESVPSVPIAEAALVEHKRAEPSDSLSAVAPAEGTAPLEYSLVPTTEDSEASDSLGALSRYLQSDTAKQILADHGFRVPGSSTPTEAESLVGAIKLTQPPKNEMLAQVSKLWNAATPQRQVLVALDVSGSMLERTEKGTRLNVAQDAIRNGMASLPETSRTGFWVYSNHIGNRGDDHLALANYGAMSDAKHRQALEKGLTGLDKTVGGGSGLYDSVLAAYEYAKRNFLAKETNVVVFVVDGPNEDDYGLDLAQLQAKLAAAKNPAKPVQLVFVGIGNQVPVDELTELAKATGGRYLPATDASDLKHVVTRAITGS